MIDVSRETGFYVLTPLPRIVPRETSGAQYHLTQYIVFYIITNTTYMKTALSVLWYKHTTSQRKRLSVSVVGKCHLATQDKENRRISHEIRRFSYYEVTYVA